MTPPQNLRKPLGVRLVAALDAKEDARLSAGPMDPVLAAIAIALIGFGVMMVYSASTVEGTVRHHDPQYFVKRQAAYAITGLLLLFGTSRIDYHRLYKLTYPVLAGVALLLLACVVGFGHSGGGAARWLAIGPIHVQPAEMAKLAVVGWLAYSLAKKADRVRNFTVGFLPHLIVAGVFMLLCMKQPDFGSAVVLLLLTFTLLFVAGARVGYILGASILAAMLAVIAVRFSAYRYLRYLAWLDMDAHKQDLAFQPYQSVMSFGSGGLWGMGLGRGLQTLYLPEAHTDFVAAIVGEELGFLGVLALCAAFLFFVVRGVRAALRAPDDYGSYLAFGIAAMFGVQALMNLAVALTLIPTKGLALPFVSYGGSSLLVNAVAVGVLLNVSRQGEALSEAGVPSREGETPSAPPPMVAEVPT
jgi:cell division protein FtsW